MNRSGRSVAEASRVIEIVDVLVASSASDAKVRTELGESMAALDRLVLGDGLDYDVAVAQLVVGHGATR